MGVIHIFSHGAEHTTAHYFERAAKTDKESVVHYWDCCPDLDKLGKEDVFIFIDPAPDWPLGLELIPCVTVVYFIDVHQELHSRLQLSRFFDVVFVAQKDYLSSFQEIGHQHVYWLPLACSPDVHYAPSIIKTFDVGFVGKLGLIGTTRHKLLTTILPRYKTNDYRKFYSPHDMAKVYGQSKIVFNASINGDLNMRFFEAMAAGALLVTDRIENGLNELFEEGVHYVGYSTIEEAIEKINYYLANDAERGQIAAQGQKFVFEQHTYQHRWEKICQLSTPISLQAPARFYSNKELGDLYSDIFASLRMPKRIWAVAVRYGLSAVVIYNWLRSWGKWLNSCIPLTPNAIRIKWKTE
jgi:glycosyltransferase involved in cell wall biosynthesis